MNRTEATPEQRRTIIGVVEQEMKEQHISVAELARRMGATRPAFYQWRNGRRPIDAEAARSFEKALHLQTGSLLKILGFIPDGMEDLARQPGAVEFILIRDPSLAADDRDTLLELYRRFKGRGLQPV